MRPAVQRAYPSRPDGVTLLAVRPFRRWLPIVLLTVAAGVFVAAWWTHDAGPRFGDVSVPTGSSATTPASGPSSVRLATMNIRRGRGMDDRTDLSRTALTLGDGEVIGLQEVGFGQAEELASRLGLHGAFAPTERRWFRDDFGNAFLSRYPASWQSIPLPRSAGQPARNVILVRARLGAETLNVVVAHLGRHQDNSSQLRQVGELFLALQPPAVLMGDLNAHAGSPQLERLRSTPGVVDVLRGRVEDDPRRVTWMLVRGLKVRDAWLRDDGASDHPALFADVGIGGEVAEPVAVVEGVTAEPADAPDQHGEDEARSRHRHASCREAVSLPMVRKATISRCDDRDSAAAVATMPFRGAAASHPR